MIDLVIAFGLALFIEGLLYSLFPVSMKKLMAFAISQDPKSLRKFGMLVIFIGLVIVAIARI